MIVGASIHRVRPFAAILSTGLAVLCSLYTACVDPWPRPSGWIEILAVNEEIKDDSSGAIIAWRVACKGQLAIERWGVTIRLDTDSRRYWVSLTTESRLPAAAASTGELFIPFDSPSERLVKGSAIVDASWFE
jgi:hypothetical protein